MTTLEGGHMATTKHSTVSGPKPGMPFAESKIAKFLTRRIDELASRKNQREIAFEIGYTKPNLISMFKRGEMKVPLDKIPALAASLETDPGYMFRLALEQYWPDLADVIAKIFGNVVSDNEMAIVKEIRKITKDGDPHLSKELAVKLKDAFGK
jgi:hypothetical protein